MTNPIVFICGPNQEFTIKQATAIGWTVLSPTQIPEGLAPCSYLPIYLAMLEAADAIYILPNSSNDNIENALIDYARAQGITMLYSVLDLYNEYHYYHPEYKQTAFLSEDNFNEY